MNVFKIILPDGSSFPILKYEIEKANIRKDMIETKIIFLNFLITKNIPKINIVLKKKDVRSPDK